MHPFQHAGWVNADRTNVVGAVKAFQATVRQTGCERAPVSLLTLEGEPPGLVFQKGLDTFVKRHHLRVWKQPGQYKGRDVWVSAATHDTGIGVAKGTKWFHRIDPRIVLGTEFSALDLLAYAVGIACLAAIDRAARRRPALDPLIQKRSRAGLTILGHVRLSGHVAMPHGGTGWAKDSNYCKERWT